MARKGTKQPKEWREKISNLLTGKKHPAWRVLKNSISKKGRHFSPATEFKKGNPAPLSAFKSGQTPWNKGKYGYVTLKKGKKIGKISASARMRKYATAPRGENHWNWKGGLTAISYLVRNSFQYRQWRSDVFERDNFTCVWCGDSRGHNLNADHIKPLSKILFEQKITSQDEAITCEELWNINNGRTLCVPCHKKTDTWGRPRNTT